MILKVNALCGASVLKTNKKKAIVSLVADDIEFL